MTKEEVSSDNTQGINDVKRTTNSTFKLIKGLSDPNYYKYRPSCQFLSFQGIYTSLLMTLFTRHCRAPWFGSLSILTCTTTSTAHAIMSRDAFPFVFSADIQRYLYCSRILLALSDNPNRAYKAGFFTDLKITCGSNQFMVHKIIVCSQSKVFHATCSNGFMVRMIFQRLTV